MKTSRQRLLEFVQSHQAITVLEISRALHMTRANARHHLAILEEQGLVEVVGQRPGNGKGRPAQLYGFSKRFQGDNLEQLASALLAEFINSLEPHQRSEGLRRVAARLKGTGRLGESVNPDAHLTQRLVTAIQRLNELNYQARWEARPGAPRLLLGRCPYAAILPYHPELCQIDAFLLEELLNAPVQQLAKQADDTRGGKYCLFSIGKQ